MREMAWQICTPKTTHSSIFSTSTWIVVIFIILTIILAELTCERGAESLE